MEDKIYIDAVKDIEKKKASFAVKRIFDVILSLIAIIILSPVLLIISIMIKLDSKGPVIFRQIRVGKNSKNFTIYKFRTMVPDAEKRSQLDINPEDMDNFVFQSKNDSRVTRTGSFLRKTSLDELPQLFNVLNGTMSIVGPRPEIPDVVKYYPDYYKQRLLVTPGITGLAQVSGRGEIELGKTVHYDLTYIKNFSAMYDLKIICRTFTSVLKQEGAY